jgi:hypothetical protein
MHNSHCLQWILHEADALKVAFSTDTYMFISFDGPHLQACPDSVEGVASIQGHNGYNTIWYK